MLFYFFYVSYEISKIVFEDMGTIKEHIFLIERFIMIMN